MNTASPPHAGTVASAHSQVTVAELSARIAQPNDVLLLDVRNDKEFAAWRVESRYTPETLHIPYVVFVEDEEEAVKQVPVRREIFAVCAKGGASAYVADILGAHGIVAANVEGGMIAWGNHYVFRPVVETQTGQIYQVDRVARGCLSYVLISQGQAAILDPLRHADRYERFLKEQGARLALVLDTHAHADHISSGPELAARTGAPYYLHPYDAIHPFDLLPPQIEFEMLQDGQQLTLGDFRLSVMHMPGHTLGQVNVLATDHAGQAYCFTGDNLFIRGFGRPDLGGKGESWAPLVYDTIFSRCREKIPPQAWVLPGHYASFDEANADGVYVRRLADLWRENPALQIGGREEFIRYTLNHLSEAPPQYTQIKRVNTGLAHPTEHEAGELELGKNVCALSP